jgi:hypothetical protein
LCHTFPIQNGLKHGDALSPLLFNFALQYAIRKIQENQVGLKLNRTHQLMAYADDVHLLGDNTDTKNKRHKHRGLSPTANYIDVRADSSLLPVAEYTVLLAPVSTICIYVQLCLAPIHFLCLLSTVHLLYPPHYLA